MGEWKSFRQGSLHYCHGYLDAMEGQSPRNPLRLQRSDGKVIREVKAKETVNIGMIAGWPPAEQYERAANEALEKAKLIRERESKSRRV